MKRGLMILIVDEIPINLYILLAPLENASYRMLVAPSGESTIKKPVYSPVDLILSF